MQSNFIRFMKIVYGFTFIEVLMLSVRYEYFESFNASSNLKKQKIDTNQGF